MTFYMNKDTTEKVVQSYRSEMLEIMQKHKDVCWLVESMFF